MINTLPQPWAIPGIKSEKPVSPLTLPVQSVLAMAAIFFNCSTAEIKAKCRHRDIIDRRMLICLYLRNRGYTLSSIGSCFRQDHTTIIHAEKNAKNMIELYPKYQKSYSELSVYLDA